MGRKARKSGDPKVAVGYIRASKEEQQLTPEAQRSAMQSWCDREALDLVAVFEDHLCGATEIDKRPGLLDALAALGEHGAGVFVVAKRDRIGRDVLVSAMVERLVEKKGAHVAAADGVGNGDTPESAMMRGIVDVFAQYERALIRARTRAALAVKKARGERIGSVPYGWKLAADKRHLEPDAGEQEIIKAARELQEEGLTLRAVGKELAARGMFPRSGSSTWNPKTVRSVLSAAVA